MSALRRAYTLRIGFREFGERVPKTVVPLDAYSVTAEPISLRQLLDAVPAGFPSPAHCVRLNSDQKRGWLASSPMSGFHSWVDASLRGMSEAFARRRTSAEFETVTLAVDPDERWHRTVREGRQERT